jgi:hypothetical protein
LWRKRLYIGFAPERISMIMLGRGLWPKALARHDEQVDADDKGAKWQAALTRLSKLLESAEWQHADVSLILSNSLCRFATIPHGAQLKSAVARDAFAKHVMKQAYGDVVEQWQLSVQHGVVAAMDRNLLNGLRQVCATSHLNLKLAAPGLRSVYNRFCPQFNDEACWLVIHEAGHALIALLCGGEIVSINGMGCMSLDELPVLLDRENLLSGLPEPCRQVYLYSPGVQDISALSKSTYQFKPLEFQVPRDFPALSEGAFAMPLCEIV